MLVFGSERPAAAADGSPAALGWCCSGHQALDVISLQHGRLVDQCPPVCGREAGAVADGSQAPERSGAPRFDRWHYRQGLM